MTSVTRWGRQKFEGSVAVHVEPPPPVSHTSTVPLPPKSGGGQGGGADETLAGPSGHAIAFVDTSAR